MMIEKKKDRKYIKILPTPTEGATKNIGIGEIYSL